MQNLRKIWLTTYRSNERALRSYRAAGFVEEGCQRSHVWSDGRYEDLVYLATFRPVASVDRTGAGSPAD